MKTLLLTVFAITLSFGVFAQEKVPVKDTIPTEQKTQKDVYLMKDTKMWVVKNGEKTLMAEEVTLANGTIVMANGTVKFEDGTSVTLKEGEFIDLDGTIGNWPKEPSESESLED